MSPTDFDESGAVGTSDLLILFANWGPCQYIDLKEAYANIGMNIVVSFTLSLPCTAIAMRMS